MEHVDVLIVGAGLSGVGAACHLETRRPGTTYCLLEARDAIGGTWDLFRYPGVRSDSDMFTLGYSFEPWVGKAIADGPSILEYIRSTARKHGVESRVRFNRRAVAASWSTPDARWTVDVEDSATGERSRLTCGFLWGTTGYYRYDHGYRPEFPGEADFGGTIVHPQHWPEDLGWQGLRIVVIGSGATAVTLVPALADGGAAHVTMLQRSPTYIVSRPGEDKVADSLRRHLPAKVAHAVVRWKNVLLTQFSFALSRQAPEMVKKGIRKGVVEALPVGYDVDTDFAPRYDPWDQRLCLVPDGDLFNAISSGRADVVTDTIDTFTPTGIRLASGVELDADVVVTATGLEMQLLGGMALEVDGTPVVPGASVAYKGIMLCAVPNLAMTFGYTNASWTLKADLTAEYVCRLLDQLERRGVRQCTPLAPDASLPTEPFIDFSSGYVTRAAQDLPRQGTTTPWRLHQNYLRDTWLLRFAKVDDSMALSNPGRWAGRSDAA